MMTSSYEHYLPLVFPYRLVGDQKIVGDAVSALLEVVEPYHNGSSFAVTVELTGGMRYLWLSKASADRVREMGYFAHELNPSPDND